MLAGHLARMARRRPVRYALDPRTQAAMHQWLRAVFAHLRMGGTHEPFEHSVNTMHREDIDPAQGGAHALAHALHQAVQGGDTDAIGPYADVVQENRLFRGRSQYFPDDDPSRILGHLVRFYQSLRDRTPEESPFLRALDPGTESGRDVADQARFLDPQRYPYGQLIRALLQRHPDPGHAAAVHQRAIGGGMGDVADLFELFGADPLRSHVLGAGNVTVPNPLHGLPNWEGPVPTRTYHLGQGNVLDNPHDVLRNMLNNLLGVLHYHGRQDLPQPGAM